MITVRRQPGTKRSFVGARVQSMDPDENCVRDIFAKSDVVEHAAESLQREGDTANVPSGLRDLQRKLQEPQNWVWQPRQTRPVFKDIREAPTGELYSWEATSDVHGQRLRLELHWDDTADQYLHRLSVRG